MDAYITSTGRFLPGPTISNDDMEKYLGKVHGKASRLKRKILQSNGIVGRHYAIDKHHQTLFSVEKMAALAGDACLEKIRCLKQSVGLLSCATTQGDLVAPGIASMVQASLKLSGVEIHSAHGICSSAAMALKAAVNSIKLGEHKKGLVVASELCSRLFKNTHYEAVESDRAVDFNAEFLRWMLSDGAGAWLVESTPSQPLSLRVDWIRSFSHADAFPVCMSVGKPLNDSGLTWQDYPTYAEAEKAGALLLRQDVRLLEHSVKLGVDGALRLIDEGLLDTQSIDYLLCHYSSHHFKSKIFDLLDKAGAKVDESKWYTNLYQRGNTGCASIFIMLDEFLETHELKPGQKILCMVPESGRFNNAYIHLTVAGTSDEQ